MRTWGLNMRILARVLALALFVPVTAAPASTFKVLYSFMNAGDGGNPDSVDLVRDNSGNLYGTTALPLGVGAVFKLDSGGNETILYYFPDGSGGARSLRASARHAGRADIRTHRLAALRGAALGFCPGTAAWHLYPVGFAGWLDPGGHARRPGA